eukprot:COSAG02_NODE_1573_length_11882_cov_5.506832_2_plen_300_part_00
MSPWRRVACHTQSTLSVEAFRKQHVEPSIPVVLKGLAGGWPALSLWAQPDYLYSVCGAERTVLCEHNERGRLFSYGSADASVALPLREVLSTYQVGGPAAERLYMAQTPVDELQPRLREDIVEPLYCSVSTPADWSKPASLLAAILPVRPPPDVYLWLGHTTSVSPLHFDTKHNLLTQIVGYKRVCLFAPAYSSALYAPHGGSSNQSQLGSIGLIDLRLYANDDSDVASSTPSTVHASVRDTFPRFVTEALPNMLVCEIGPGDALYIPSGWWHHVQAITPPLHKESADGFVLSVNFWWV